MFSRVADLIRSCWSCLCFHQHPSGLLLANQDLAVHLRPYDSVQEAKIVLKYKRYIQSIGALTSGWLELSGAAVRSVSRAGMSGSLKVNISVLHLQDETSTNLPGVQSN
jgi:hypothetical protein